MRIITMRIKIWKRKKTAIRSEAWAVRTTIMVMARGREETSKIHKHKTREGREKGRRGGERERAREGGRKMQVRRLSNPLEVIRG